ncbi:MAG: MOSC domain-containing protein [Geitlerinemataceae cyanobacterium]
MPTPNPAETAPAIEPIVRRLFCHPVKGLTPAEPERAQFTAEWGMQGDRVFALMFDDGKRKPAPDLPWLSKRYFAVQNDWPDLARLHCTYDRAAQTLTVERDGKLEIEAHVDREREAIGQWFAEFLRGCKPSPGARHPKLAPLTLVGQPSETTTFRDRLHGQVSLIGTATLAALEKLSEQPVDPRRFRPNLVVETATPWEEFGWIGKTWRCGEVEFEPIERIQRCINIEVCPDSGERDLPLLPLLKRNFRHTDTGVIARVVKGGAIAVGDRYAV